MIEVGSPLHANGDLVVTRRKRIFELKAEFEVPLCVASALCDFEAGLPDKNEVWFAGAEFETLTDGSRRITDGPLASGCCRNSRCPDCT